VVSALPELKKVLNALHDFIQSCPVSEKKDIEKIDNK
jgi:hypothetical protein